MTFELSVFGLASLVSATVALVSGFALRLMDTSDNSKSNWLSTWLCLIGISSSTQLLAELGLLEEVPIATVFVAGIPFLAGPSIYAYLTVVLGDVSVSRRPLIVVAGTGLALGVAWWRSIEREGQFLTPESVLLATVFYVLTLTYLFATLLRIRHFRKDAPANYSDPRIADLNWLAAVCAAYIAVLLIDIALGYLLTSAKISVHTAGAVLSSALTAFAAVLSFFALRQPTGLRNDSVVSATKYASSALSDQDYDRITEKLEAAMLQDQYFLDSELTLVSLAEHLETGRHLLSQTINQRFGKNFYRYINDFRIDHAKSLLLRSDKSVLEIAFECGYNNKASFYKAFREICSQTPGQYRRSRQSPTQTDAHLT